MSTTTARGNAGENAAAEHLERHGLTIVERNYRTKMGEIDLIARTAEELVFVEVRLRGRDDYGSPLESISRAKRNRILRSASLYLMRFSRAPACRFDVVAITPSPEAPNTMTIEWLPAAFDASGSQWRG